MSGVSVACSGSVRYHDEEYTPSGAYMPPQGMARGMKKPGMPPIYVDRLAYQWFAQGPAIGSTHPPSWTMTSSPAVHAKWLVFGCMIMMLPGDRAIDCCLSSLSPMPM